MNKLLVGSLVVMMLAGLPACDPPAGSPATPKTAAPAAPETKDQAPKPTGETKPVESAKPAEPAKPAAEVTQDTAAGAAKLFVAAMSAGDYMRASDLCDPGSEGRDEILDAAKMIEDANAKQDAGLKQAIQMILGAMTKPWQGAEIVTGPEEGRNAPCTFKLTNGTTKDIVMQKTDGKWFVFATKGIVTVTPTGVPAPAKPAAPAPAPDKPGEQPPK